MKIKLSVLTQMIKEEVEHGLLEQGGGTIIRYIAAAIFSTIWRSTRMHGDSTPGVRYQVTVEVRGLVPGAAPLVPQALIQAARELMPNDSSPNAEWVSGGRILFSFYINYETNPEAQQREYISELATNVAYTFKRAEEILHMQRSDLANVVLNVDTEHTTWHAELPPR